MSASSPLSELAGTSPGCDPAVHSFKECTGLVPQSTRLGVHWFGPTVHWFGSALVWEPPAIPTGCYRRSQLHGAGTWTQDWDHWA